MSAPSFPALADGFAYLRQRRRLAGPAARSRSAISDYLLTTSVQTGASYEHSQRATERLLEARAAIARLVNAARPEEIVLGPSTTVLCAFLATRHGEPVRAGRRGRSSPTSTTSPTSAPGCALEERGVVSKTWSIDRESLRGRPRRPRTADDRAHQARLRHARLEHPRHHQSDRGDRPARARARRRDRASTRVAYAPHRAVDVRGARTSITTCSASTRPTGRISPCCTAATTSCSSSTACTTTSTAATKSR